MTDMTDEPTIETSVPATPSLSPFASPFASTADPKPEPKPTGVNADVIALLTEAKERLAVNALSDVGYCIGRAIIVLGG
jgi:hypothetical protein